MNYLRKFLQQDRDYFAHNQESISQQNRMILKLACLLYLGVLTIYTIITVLTEQSETLARMYYTYDVIHLILCTVVLLELKHQPPRLKNFNFYRIVLEITLLSFFLIEAVFPFPEQGSIYFPFPIILLVMIFIYRTAYALGLIFSYIGTFVILTCLFKAAEIQTHDLYIASGTLVSALIGYGIVANLRHETSKAIKQLEYLGTVDSLTGLYNKKTIEILCQSYIADPDNPSNYALLIFDVDRFKQVNDNFGHAVGDLVLKGIGETMQTTFSSKNFLGRFGGDEFVAFIPDFPEKEAIQNSLDKFAIKLNLLAKNLKLPNLSCSIGIAVQAKPKESYFALLLRADSALYTAKANGRGQSCFAEDNLGQDQEQQLGEMG